MTRTSKIVVLVAIAALALGVTALLLAQAAPAPPAPAAKGHDALTVYVDVSALGRKHSAAEKMTKLHAEKAAEGYTFASMAVYTENGDLQGFYVTYVKEQ